MTSARTHEMTLIEHEPFALRDCSSINNAPLVSISIIAYNIARYLPKTLESILDQVVDFSIEVVIGEDCSTDETLAIANEYQQKYPHIIRVLPAAKNLGLTPNFVRTQNACKGKYIALCDGDDYWTDIYKLDKQIKFLETHPECVGAAHQCMVVFEDKSEADHLFGPLNDQLYTLHDLIAHRHFHTSSLVFKRSTWETAGGIPTNIISNERALYPILAIYGPIFYSNENMGVYLRNNFGLSSRISIADLSSDLNMIPWIKGLSPSFPINRFRSFLHLTTYTYAIHIQLGDLIKHFLSFAFYSFSYFPKNLGDLKYGLQKCIKIAFQKTDRKSHI